MLRVSAPSGPPGSPGSPRDRGLLMHAGGLAGGRDARMCHDATANRGIIVGRAVHSLRTEATPSPNFLSVLSACHVLALRGEDVKHTRKDPMKDLKSGSSSAENSPALENRKRPLRKKLASASLGGSPASVQAMWSDWAVHFAMAPDLQVEMARSAGEGWWQWARYVSMGCPDDPALRPVAPAESDRRFGSDEWRKPPFAAMAQGFLLLETLADQAARNVPGLDSSRQASMAFLTRQVLDAMAPSNFPATNPDVLARTLATGGANIHHGLDRAVRDIRDGPHAGASRDVGKDVATAPGKVVCRNHLIELIQYEPTTGTVYPEPVLIVPAWIMKYYILDLSHGNSLVRYLTGQGFTVFMISWRNPTAGDAHYGMHDYLDLGPRAALDVIESRTGTRKVHATGYCLGGTLLSVAAAAMARDGDDRLASMTLFAAQTDFSEPGELGLFINESQVSFLEDVMEEQGYLDATQMMSAFQMLRSNDLIWSRMIRKYLLGEDDAPMSDLMAWNADTTRMPARMHSEYLRHMFLDNDLAAGRYHVDGHHVSLRDIRIPVFAVGTETDHIAPWRSVFKIHTLGHADVTFALTNGGHNAGVVSEPGHKRRSYRIHTVRDRDKALSPEDWMEVAHRQDGSWWPAWASWLAARSGQRRAPPGIGKALCDAPGTYVLQE